LKGKREQAVFERGILQGGDVSDEDVGEVSKAHNNRDALPLATRR
jgi:hypothetical protein